MAPTERFVNTTWFDTPVIQDTITGRYSLDDLCQRYLPEDWRAFKEEFLASEMASELDAELMKKDHEHLSIEIDNRTFVHGIAMHSILSRLDPCYLMQAMELISLELRRTQLENEIKALRRGESPQPMTIKEMLDASIERESQSLNRKRRRE